MTELESLDYMDFINPDDEQETIESVLSERMINRTNNFDQGE